LVVVVGVDRVAHEVVDVVVVDGQVLHLCIVELPYGVDSKVVSTVLVPFERPCLGVELVD